MLVLESAAPLRTHRQCSRHQTVRRMGVACYKLDIVAYFKAFELMRTGEETFKGFIKVR